MTSTFPPYVLTISWTLARMAGALSGGSTWPFSVNLTNVMVLIITHLLVVGAGEARAFSKSVRPHRAELKEAMVPRRQGLPDRVAASDPFPRPGAPCSRRRSGLGPRGRDPAAATAAPRPRRIDRGSHRVPPPTARSAAPP